MKWMGTERRKAAVERKWVRERKGETKRKRGGKWTQEKNGAGWTETEHGLWRGFERLDTGVKTRFFVSSLLGDGTAMTRGGCAD